MPFYEYQCKNCGHELEAMQKISEEPLKKCPHCGKPQLQRLMSAPVFRLKGSGWYETDFKDDKDKKKNLADRPEAEPAKDSTVKAAEKDAAPDAGAKSDKPAAKEADAPKKTAEKTEKPAVRAAKKGKPKPVAKKKASKARKH